MNISDTGLRLITEFEGLRLAAYPDPGTGGEPWTIGVGHTGGVHLGDTCTEEQAMDWLRSDVRYAESAVEHLVKVPLDQGQFDALVSFVFNCGQGAFGQSTMLRLLNAGDYDGASRQFGRWNKAGNQELPGLTRRRAAEAKLFSTGQYP